MKSVRTITVTRLQGGTYEGSVMPKHKVGDYVRVYCGTNEGHCFTIKDIRFNEDIDKFEYLYPGPMGGWHAEDMIVPASSRQGWHYDSQGYCDNPGRGY